MLPPKDFFEYLNKKEITFFAGVPDSLLKFFCGYVADHAGDSNHVIAANEGGAVGLAIGYHLATQRIPLIYMQNSGLGNAINPLLSLADSDIYAIPMLLLIGWRGNPEEKDEPQHLKQGKVMIPMIESMKIPYDILSGSLDEDKKVIDEALLKINNDKCPFALIAKKNTFEEYKYQDVSKQDFSLTREETLKLIIDMLNKKDLVISTTGMCSREIFEYREALHQNHGSDFLTVGGMGHASQIALGIAKNCPEKHIICIDGDGSALMHLGSMAVNASQKCKNFKHIIINNGSHDSVGGQPTVALDINLNTMCRSMGYTVIENDNSEKDIQRSLKEVLKIEGPAFLEIKVNKGSRKNLGRPTTSPKENKLSFIENIK